MIKLQIPSILAQRDALKLRDELVKLVKDGKEIELDLDQISEFDIAGFNALVAPYYESLGAAGRLKLSLHNNPDLLEMFEIARLDFILNT